MKPELTSFLHIGSYSVFLLAGFLGGYLLSRWRAVKVGMDTRHVDNLCLVMPVAGLLGGRLFNRIFYMEHAHWWEALLVWKGGGLVFYGGFLFAFGALIGYGIWRRLRLGELLDLFAPGLALGLALGRVGCFLAGCCWGDVCADSATLAQVPEEAVRYQVQTFPSISRPGLFWAVRFPPKSGPYDQQLKLGLISEGSAASLPVHPVQLYEAVFAGMLAVWLHGRFRRRRWAGQIACDLCVAYSCGRFLLEFLRADNALGHGWLTLSQWISLILAAAAGAVLFWRKREASALGSQFPVLRCGMSVDLGGSQERSR